MVQTFSLYALVGVDEHIDPAQAPRKGRFVLRADSIRPYSLGGEAGSIRPTALSRQVAGGFYPPLQDYRTLFKKSCNLGFWGLPKIC